MAQILTPKYLPKRKRKCVHRELYINIHRNLILTKRLEAAQIPINRRTDKC